MAKNSLVNNINRKKKSSTSRSKKKSTVSKAAYQDMQQGWPKKGKKDQEQMTLRKRHQIKDPKGGERVISEYERDNQVVEG